ncbi:MAG: FAD:protein FMN transferase [Acidimicrobiia bacterium]
MRVDTTFPAMGSTAHVTVVGGTVGLSEAARERLADLEARWSRFIPTSEVSRLNHAQGRPCIVSEETRLLVRRALDGYAVTAGRFDPTLLGAVLRAGYVESFDRRPPRPRASGSTLRTGADRIEIDEAVGTVRIPVGVGFDPGGIGKGLAADLVSAELIDQGAVGVSVNVGGDLRVRGDAPDGEAWRIAIDDPWGRTAPIARIRLRDGAVATSSRLDRRWVRADGAVQHHLLDPDTGTSACTPVLASTVVAAAGWQAEALSKAVFLDAHRGMELVNGRGSAALVVLPDGLLTTRGWSALTDVAMAGSGVGS